jgi:hypothetical protein
VKNKTPLFLFSRAERGAIEIYFRDKGGLVASPTASTFATALAIFVVATATAATSVGMQKSLNLGAFVFSSLMSLKDLTREVEIHTGKRMVKVQGYFFVVHVNHLSFDTLSISGLHGYASPYEYVFLVEFPIFVTEDFVVEREYSIGETLSVTIFGSKLKIESFSLFESF